MYATYETAQLDHMPSPPSAAVLDRAAPAPYATSRSAALARPSLSIAAFRSARRSRAVRLSWIGLVRR